MAGGEVCVFCDVLLSEYPVNTVRKLGLETIRKCCVKRKDGKDALFAGLESLTVHKKCWRSYTNEKNVSAAERGTSRARANPAPINVPVDAVPQVARVDFSFEDDCIFCDEELTDAFKQSEKKKPVEKRIVVSTVISEHTKASIEQVARKYPSEWSTKGCQVSTLDDTENVAAHGVPPPATSKNAFKRAKTEKKLMKLAFEHLSENKDEYNYWAMACAADLRKMDQIQQIYAKKAIAEILMDGQLGLLHRNSVKINESAPIENLRPSASPT